MDKFTIDYLKSIERDEFIHWAGVHVGPGSGMWGFCEGHIWNEKLKSFIENNPSIHFISDGNQNGDIPYISRFFDNNTIKIIISTNDDAGILRVVDKNVSGVDGVLNDNINTFLSKNPHRDVDTESNELYVLTSPEPNGGSFPSVYDMFNEPPSNIKRIYSKGLMCTDNDKFRVLPNGLCNITIEPIRDKVLFDEEKRIDNLVCLNFRPGTNTERIKIENYYKEKEWATIGVGQQFEYLKEMYHHKFVISPESNCADSHRTWEAMYLGTIPIVQRRPGMSWFDDLPILQVDDMCSLTKSYLEEKYEEIMSKDYNLDKLKISYWLNQISEDINV